MRIIIRESQYNKLMKEYYYAGTKKPLGANGVDQDVFKSILELIPILFSADTKALPLVTKVKGQNKVKNEDKLPVKQYLNQINDYCKKNPDFKYDEWNINICREINEILSSDNDNIFSDSYGFA